VFGTPVIYKLKGAGRKSLEVSWKLLIKIREYFMRVNIRNQPKFLNDNTKCVNLLSMGVLPFSYKRSSLPHKGFKWTKGFYKIGCWGSLRRRHQRRNRIDILKVTLIYDYMSEKYGLCWLESAGPISLNFFWNKFSHYFCKFDCFVLLILIYWNSLTYKKSK